MKIDHRSYREWRINLEPQRKVYIANIKHRQYDEHIYNRREIALDALTKQQPTFFADDLAKFVNRHALDPERFQQVHERVKLKDHLKRKRFSSKEMLALDTDILKSTSNLELKLKLEPFIT